MTKRKDQLCVQSHYVAIVEAQKDVEIYQVGDIDCPDCLRRMAEKHAALTEVFRARLAVSSRRCRIYDTECINPSYCDARSLEWEIETCCAGDPGCVPPSGREEAP